MKLDLLVKDPTVRGALALFPVFSSSPVAPGYLTGPEADAADLLTVGEHDAGATVPELVVHNTAKSPVLLVEGETLLGAWQNRTLNVSVLVPAGGKLTIPVTCVEAGRWNDTQPMGRSGRHAPSDLRRLKTASVNAARADGFGTVSDQGAVWDRIRGYEADLSVPSPTHALDDMYREVQPDLDAAVDGLEPAADQCGVVVAIGGKVCGTDIFDKRSTLAAYWAGLLAGYAVDALRQDAGAGSLADAESFVARVLDASDVSERAVGMGHDHALTSDSVSGHALEWEGAIVHLAAFATEPGRDAVRTRVIDRRHWIAS